MRAFIFLIIFLLPIHCVFAQRVLIDSLSLCLKKHESNKNYQLDSNYINLLNQLSFAYQTSNLDSMLLLANKSIKLSNQAKFFKQKVDAIYNQGTVYTAKGKINLSIEYYAEGLALANKIGYKKGIGKLYNGIANNYSKESKYPEALEYYLKALKILEDIKEKKGIATCLNNIAIIYNNQEKYEEAIMYYTKSLIIKKEMHDEDGIAKSLQGIALIYYKQKIYDKSLENDLKALEIREKLKDKTAIAMSCVTIGKTYTEKKEFSEAKKYTERASNLVYEIKNEYIKAWVLEGIGETYCMTHEYKKAESYIKQSLEIAEKMHYNEFIRDNTDNLSQIYEHLENYKLALLYQKRFKSKADSINNTAVEQKLANLTAKYEYDKKEIILKNKHEQKIKQQYNIIFLVIMILVILLIVFVVIMYSYRKIQRINKLLHLQKKEIQTLNNDLESKVKERTEHLENANQKLVEYSFYNSHIVRRPVANILGLISIFNYKNVADPINIQILEMLHACTKELDDILYKINQNLER